MTMTSRNTIKMIEAKESYHQLIMTKGTIVTRKINHHTIENPNSNLNIKSFIINLYHIKILLTERVTLSLLHPDKHLNFEVQLVTLNDFCHLDPQLVVLIQLYYPCK